jgi:hypothetical protein
MHRKLGEMTGFQKILPQKRDIHHTKANFFPKNPQNPPHLQKIMYI